VFDHNGSSHAHRQDRTAHLAIESGHLAHVAKINPTDTVIVILPDNNHLLDYYNNQFFKQQHGQLIQYISTQLSPTDVKHKLTAHWNYNGNFDDTIPRWIIREWCSFWITDSWSNGVNREQFSAIVPSIQVEISNLITCFTQTFQDIVTQAGLKVNVDIDIIHNTHNEFLNKQRFHNSQINCNHWVNVAMNTNIDMPIASQTIFDEAYIQYLLRQHGYEMQCDELNIFPDTTLCLKNIIYKI